MARQTYSVQALVWCVTPTPRMDSNLQQQAKFIEMFTPDNPLTEEIEAGQIWQNVVIVCKSKAWNHTV